MAGDEYASVGGGSLKLKGVKGSKISKQKRRKHRQPGAEKDSAGEARPSSAEGGEAAGDEGNASPGPGNSGDTASDPRDNGRELLERTKAEPDLALLQTAGKTAAEIRHEERRRKMLNDRLKREGTKSHKERVEELNKYLSGLSEHHDMPRIGPG